MTRTAASRLIVVLPLLAASAPLADTLAPSAALAATPSSAPAPICARGESAVVVDTGNRRLHLCHGGASEENFTVALGMSGVDKRHTGDNRTPLGVYPLGTPRGSQQFHRFIPVGYPTAAQQRAGYTGSAIGIHGPPRGLQVVARLALLVTSNWTAGCIAVASDDEINRIAAWVDAHQIHTVRLVR